MCGGAVIAVETECEEAVSGNGYIGPVEPHLGARQGRADNQRALRHLALQFERRHGVRNGRRSGGEDEGRKKRDRPDHEDDCSSIWRFSEISALA